MSIELSNVVKRFGKVTALDDVSVRFEKKKICGLLGRNGAGKTTLLNIITSRIFLDTGDVFVDGEPALENDRAMRKIYMMGEATLYPENMQVRDVFRWTREFYPGFDLDYAFSLAESFNLDCRKKVKSLSTGYTSILKNIAALASNADYILLDEPVLGLDANHRDMLYKFIIEKYAEKQNTIVISTHLIEEVSVLIEDVVIIDGGRIIFNGTRDDLLSCGYSVLGPAELVNKYTKDKEVIGAEALGGIKKAYIWGKLEPENIPEELDIAPVDLQRLFIQLTNTRQG